MHSKQPGRQTARILGTLALIALVAVGIFGVLAWRSVLIQTATADEANLRFEKVTTQFAGSEPLLSIDGNGVVRRRMPSAPPTVPPNRLRVLAYRAVQKRLVRADVPFWFLKMKGTAAQFSLRDTDFDLERLGLTPADLEASGAGLVLDQTRPNGDRLVVWTE